MVVFTCNHCGESLHKPSVEKHYAFVCRRVKSLTCVDCFKDFREEEYVVHTKCITEEERYAAKGSMPNGVVKKGELKQESWVDMIRSILDKEQNLKQSQRNLLETISNYNNIPRKKPKFMNFIKSSSGGRVNMREVEDVWNIIEKYKNLKASQNNVNNGKSTDTQSVSEDMNLKKRKNTEESNNGQPEQKKTKGLLNEIEETSVEEPIVCQKFDFLTKIVNILESKGTISIKKLEKKVVNAYLKHSGACEVTPKIINKIHKKLKKVPNLEVLDNKVSIKSV